MHVCNVPNDSLWRDKADKEDSMMIPVAQCVTTVEENQQQPTIRREKLPVAKCVATIHESSVLQPKNQSSEMQIEVVADANGGFDTPSAQTLVTEEDQEANARDQTITGQELLTRLKEHRKKTTARSAMIGGIIGFLFLGPIGALGAGVGTAVVTKRRLKKKEKSVRRHLNGRLDQPLRIVSRRVACPRRSQCLGGSVL